MCRGCYLLYKRAYAKNRADTLGRYRHSLTCIACSSPYLGWRNKNALCPDCYKRKRELAAQGVATNNYENAGGGGYCWKHRKIAEELVGRKLNSSEVVHHIDENPRNNEITNLLVISRSMHGKLHLYLDTQRVILAKALNENFENCWNTLIAPMTTAWLETMGAKVIKLWEIGQSAAELGSGNTQEGSETMHETPVTDKAVGEDMVQTTT